MGCFSLDPKAAENSDPLLMVQHLLCSSLPCVILYSFPKGLQTGSNYLRNIVSRIISVLLTFSPSWETYQVSCSALPSITSACVTPILSTQPVMLLSHYHPSPFPTSPSSRLPVSRVPQQPHLSPLTGAAPLAQAQPGAQ